MSTLRRVCAGVLAAAVVAVPAAIGGDPGKYKGDMDRGGKVRFTVESGAGGRRMVKFYSEGQRADCDRGRIRMFGGFAAPGIPIAEDGSFHARLEGDEETNPKDWLELDGVLDEEDGAAGTFQEFLKKPTVNSRRYRNCNTGVLDWTAERQ